MSNLDRIKSKYAKLIRLGMDTCNEHEAKNALIKAARLLQKFQLEEGDFYNDGIEIVAKIFGVGKKALSQSKRILLNGICHSQGVYLCVNTSRGLSYYTLVGTVESIEVVNYIFAVCLTKMSELKDEYFAKHYPAPNRKNMNDYERGLCIGKAATFKKSAKEAEIGTGLVPVDTRRMDAESFYKRDHKTHVSRNTTRNNTHTMQGIKDGKSITTNAGVNGAGQNRIG